jgi:hypothetical protein
VTIGEALEAAASGLKGVERRTVSGGTEWATGGAVFAAVGGDTAEFRLDPVVGRAALATPDAGPSSRGPDWVAFGPAQLDRFAIDRAAAWFGSAYRRAAAQPRVGGQESPGPGR